MPRSERILEQPLTYVDAAILAQLNELVDPSTISHGAKILRDQSDGEKFIVADFETAPPENMSMAAIEAGMTLSELASLPPLKRKEFIEARFHPVNSFDVTNFDLLEEKEGRRRTAFGLVDIAESQTQIGGFASDGFTRIPLPRLGTRIRT